MCLLGKGLIKRREAEVSSGSDRSVCGRARVTAPVCAAAGAAPAQTAVERVS